MTTTPCFGFRAWFASFVILLSLVTRLAAQSGAAVVEGRVQNAVTGDYLNNARVAVPGTALVALTDAAGAYRISGVPAGSVTLRVTYTGLDEQQATLAVSPGATVTRDFNLSSVQRYGTAGETVTLGAFTVAATREMDANSIAINEQRFAPNIKNVIAANAFGDVSEGNLGEFVKRLPGVTVNSAAGDSASITLRGFSPAFTPISIDGDRMPSASTSATAASRMTNLETLSISNVARVEVIKSPVPSMWADSLGGAVNLISKSAFDRSRPELTFRGLVQFSGEDHEIGKTASPGGTQARKVRPGYEFTYIRPVSESFGFSISSLYSDQFGRLRTANGTWEYATANGCSETAPFLRAAGINDDPRITKRITHSANADWRPFRALTLTLGYQNSQYDLFTAPTRISINTGATPTASSGEFTQGRAGAGTIAYAPIWASKYGDTDKFRFEAKYKDGDWKIDFGGSYAFSENKYRDTSEGFFRGVTTRIVTPTVRFAGVKTPGAPTTIELRNTTGALIDWKQLSNHQIVTATSAVRDAENEISSARLDVKRDFKLGTVPAAIQAGGAWRKQVLDWSAIEQSWNFLGADGRAGTADDSAGVLLDQEFTSVNPQYRWPSDIQWPDMNTFYALYRQHPEYFAHDALNAFISQATNTERIQETLSAAYVQGDLRLLANRLWIVGGVRFERTADKGVGLLRDRNAVYQRDARGALVRNAAGQPILRTTDPLQQARLQYVPRGLSASRSYDDYYPSANATYNLTDSIALRFGYAKTVGRPDFVNVVPNIDINEDVNAVPGRPGGTINVRNVNLKPWTANGYDLSLEYYFKGTGVVSIGVFRKNVKDAFGTVTSAVDDALLSEFNLDPSYRDWTLVSRFNIGSPVRITGYELNYQQEITFVPAWARGFSIYGNGTFLDIDGPQVDYGNLLEKSINWGLSYSRGRIGARLDWNWVGGQRTGSAAFAPDAATYTQDVLRLDGSVEVRLDRRFSLFFNGRNISNPSVGNETYSSRSPDYAKQPGATLAGIKFSAGIRGTF